MTGAPAPEATDLPPRPGPRPLTVTGLLLLDPHGHDPTPVESITFDDDGIGVVRSRGQAPRVLPWDAVVAHAVEPWAGGVIPAWLVEPEAARTAAAEPAPPAEPTGTVAGVDGTGAGGPGTPLPVASAARSDGTGRPLPHAGAGAMISIQTRTGTYRFLRTGGDPSGLAARIAEFTVRHRGPAGVSTVTTVVPGRPGPRTRWARLRPWLIVLLVGVLAAAVTVILLQSAGVVHLPFLGGGSAGGGALAPVAGPPGP